MKTLLASLIALAAAWSLHAQSGDPVALAAKIQQRYNAIKDIQGEFVQSYEGGVLRTRTTERGTVAIKRPGRMRFLYTKPEKKEFVSDGNRLYAYMVADKQVIVSPAPGPDQGDIPAMFLAGQSDLARDYIPTFTALPGARHVEAGPEKTQLGVRVARHRNRPEDASNPVPDRGRHPGRPIVVYFR
jgi:outer membrane lipoprotein carrier protein